MNILALLFLVFSFNAVAGEGGDLDHEREMRRQAAKREAYNRDKQAYREREKAIEQEARKIAETIRANQQPKTPIINTPEQKTTGSSHNSYNTPAPSTGLVYTTAQNARAYERRWQKIRDKYKQESEQWKKDYLNLKAECQNKLMQSQANMFQMRANLAYREQGGETVGRYLQQKADDMRRQAAWTGAGAMQ